MNPDADDQQTPADDWPVPTADVLRSLERTQVWTFAAGDASEAA